MARMVTVFQRPPTIHGVIAGVYLIGFLTILCSPPAVTLYWVAFAC
ncbi:hypothetical protein KT71_000969 [Congregibacter litoralis KT71]|uniref:Uncharacterized protein n=1 Tax=Congregibacter litoralis KT71 TaxID=314285 RepID=V7HUZ3_9GAMM|nr:hypothetical protein KT71_000969 [Congregibacter litoralis KT71]